MARGRRPALADSLRCLQALLQLNKERGKARCAVSRKPMARFILLRQDLGDDPTADGTGAELGIKDATVPIGGTNPSLPGAAGQSSFGRRAWLQAHGGPDKMQQTRCTGLG